MSAEWGTAIWGTDLWGAVQLGDLMQQPPLNDGRGAPLGVFDWRFVVEMLLPTDPTSVWGIGEWGEATWGELQWADITPDVRGLSWGRGADEPYGRPRVGDGQLTLASLDDQWNPWEPSPPLGSGAYFAPGTLVRAGCRSALDTRAGGWLPQFTMLVDSWPVQFVGARGVDRFVDVQLVETTRQLAGIDDNALSGLVGGGETGMERFERLLDAAAWPYGLKADAEGPQWGSTVQSTDMAQNRLAELYVTADSLDCIFRADRTGAAFVSSLEYIGGTGDPDPENWPLVEFSAYPAGVGFKWPTIGFDYFDYETLSPVGELYWLPYRAETFVSDNDDDNIANDCRFARVGGSQQVFEQLASIARYGRRTLVRNDLICTSDALALQIAQYVSIRRSLNTLRVAGITINTLDRGAEQALVMMAADVGVMAWARSPLVASAPALRPTIVGFLAGLEHDVVLGAKGVKDWTTRVSIDTRTVYFLPGAQLPSTQP